MVYPQVGPEHHLLQRLSKFEGVRTLVGKPRHHLGWTRGETFSVQCMYAVMRSATCDFTTIASGWMILSIKSIIRKTWGSECPFRQSHENTGRSGAVTLVAIFWSILPLLFYAFLDCQLHDGTRAKWLAVPKSRLPLMSMKTSGYANTNSKQEHTVQILSLHKVPECSGMGCAWPCICIDMLGPTSLVLPFSLLSILVCLNGRRWPPRRWRWNLEAYWSCLFYQVLTSRPS